MILRSENVATPLDAVWDSVPLRVADPGLVFIAIDTLDEESLVHVLPNESYSVTLYEGAIATPATILDAAAGCWVIPIEAALAGTILNEFVVTLGSAPNVAFRS